MEKKLTPYFAFVTIALKMITAMSAAIGAIYADGPVIVERAEAVAKSYPGFWEDYAALGGKIEFL